MDSSLSNENKERINTLEQRIDNNHELISLNISAIKESLSEMNQQLSKLSLEGIQLFVNEKIYQSERDNKVVFASKWVEKFSIGVISVVGTALLLAGLGVIIG